MTPPPPAHTPPPPSSGPGEIVYSLVRHGDKTIAAYQKPGGCMHVQVMCQVIAQQHDMTGSATLNYTMVNAGSHIDCDMGNVVCRVKDDYLLLICYTGKIPSEHIGYYLSAIHGSAVEQYIQESKNATYTADDLNEILKIAFIQSILFSNKVEKNAIGKTLTRDEISTAYKAEVGMFADRVEAFHQS